MSETFTPADVASHNSADKGLYIIIDGNVFDVTKFVDEHPGGAKILKRVAGKDATKQFWKVWSTLILRPFVSIAIFLLHSRQSSRLLNTVVLTPLQYHNESVLKKYSPKLKIGEVKDAAKL